MKGGKGNNLLIECYNCSYKCEHATHRTDNSGEICLGTSINASGTDVERAPNRAKKQKRKETHPKLRVTGRRASQTQSTQTQTERGSERKHKRRQKCEHAQETRKGAPRIASTRARKTRASRKRTQARASRYVKANTRRRKEPKQ